MIEINLTSLSPVSFLFAKVGDLLEIKKKIPTQKEFRGQKIGSGTVSYLVFKGATKIGMIPSEFIQNNGVGTLRRRCRVKAISKENQLITIEIPN